MGDSDNMLLVLLLLLLRINHNLAESMKASVSKGNFRLLLAECSNCETTLFLQ